MMVKAGWGRSQGLSLLESSPTGLLSGYPDVVCVLWTQLETFQCWQGAEQFVDVGTMESKMESKRR